jgi:hypothetical protein
MESVHSAESGQLRRNSAKRSFDIRDFCERYGIGKTRAYAEIAAGQLRARKCGRRLLITEDDAENWLHNLPLRRSASTEAIA